jgi:plasmid stabilization system protein ParE
MKMDLEITRTAIEEFEECIKYVEENFSSKKAMDFVLKMEHTFNLICKNPTAFPLSDYHDIRYVVVIKSITVFYTINNEKTVQVVNIWNNRKDKNESKIKK